MKQNKERDEKVLNLFNNKKTCFEIANKLKISKLTVKKVLLNFGIDYSKKIKEDKEFKLKQIPILYSQGKSQLNLEKELGLTRKTIRNVLKNSDIEYRSQSNSISLGNGHYINHNAFDDLTDSKTLYFIGFIYTDGHVTIDNKRGINGIEISVHKQDVDILEKFRDFLQCNYNIEFRNNYARLRVYSKKLCEVLKGLGFTSRKTYDLIPHEKLKNSRDFWRGCIDGDGCLSFNSGKQEYWIINLVGTKDTCLGFMDFINNNNIENRRYITKSDGVNLYRITYSADKARQVSELLYKDSEVYLNRKYQKYLEIQEYYKII